MHRDAPDTDDFAGVASLHAVDAPDERDKRTLVDPADHYGTARKLLETHHWHSDAFTLAYWQGAFYEWIGPRWRALDSEALPLKVYRWLATECVVRESHGAGSPVVRSAKPTARWRNEVVLALQALCCREAHAAYGWHGAPELTRPLSVENGILCLESLRLDAHTPRLFNVTSIDAPWQPVDTEPGGPFLDWVRDALVDRSTGEGEDQISLLQRVLGYLLSGDTDLQKIFLITGERRSGKGTFGRLLVKLMHREVASISARALEGQFGLQNTIGKSVALLPDVRVDKNTRMAPLTELLLSISGEDAQTVQRKFKSDWNGPLPVRFVIMSNGVPQLQDPTGVLQSRFVYLTMPNSNFGTEDVRLDEKLWKDRAAVLRWAVGGYRQLCDDGGRLPNTVYHQVTSKRAAIRMDPVGDFIREHLTVTGSHSDMVRMEDLYGLFTRYLDGHGLPAMFEDGFCKRFWQGDDPRIWKKRRSDGSVKRTFAMGVRLREAWTEAELRELRDELR